MKAFEIYADGLPTNSLLNTTFPAINYQDCFTGVFESQNQVTIDDCVFAFFDCAPAWVSNLLALRNTIVKMLGLKTMTSENRTELRKKFKVKEGNSLGLFKILVKTKQEVIMGVDDKHLNFRVSLLLDQSEKPESYRLSITTVVQMNNWFGKLYFMPVKPIHKLIVPVMLRGIIRHLQKPKFK
jgi:hypothetical protein